MSKATKSKRRRWPPSKAELEALIEEAIVDAYGESEQLTGFYTMLEDHLAVPFEVEILGATATVERIDMTKDEQIVAVCRRGRSRQAIPVLELRLPKAPPDRERLRLLVSFGSIIARTGLRGEADYALANEWLARLTEDFGRRHPGCRCLTLEWSVWSGVGMGERLGRVDALARAGITALSVDQGVSLFLRLLASGAAGTRILCGRVPDVPTLRFERPELPFRRFLERPRVYFPGVELVADSDLSSGSDPYLEEHVLGGQRIFPAVMGLEAMAQAASALVDGNELMRLEEVEFARPIVVPEKGTQTLRVAALVRDSGPVDVALRCANTCFKVDHFRAQCRVHRSSEAETPAELPKLRGADIGLDARRDLYGGLLFHGGRFRRLGAYRHLDAGRCRCDILQGDRASWFGRYLPPDLVLGDPGARDAAVHSTQACIPHLRLLPVGVERILLRDACADEPRSVEAVERWHRGDFFCFDLEVRNPDGRLLEAWRGLKLRKMEPVSNGAWVAPLLATYVARRVEELIPDARLRVALKARTKRGARRAASDETMATVLDGHDALRRRGDGKPHAIGGRAALSAAHVDGLALAVAGREPVACDLEFIRERTYLQWEALLSSVHGALAQVVAGEGFESYERAATRVWTARECLKKAGASLDTPLTLAGRAPDGWVLLGAGQHTIATYVARLATERRPLALALLVGRRHASL